jgi:hypothetical protein
MSLAVRGVQFFAASAAIVGALLIPAGAVHAKATVFRFTFGPNTETFTGPLEGCLSPDLIGTATLTETTTGHVADTGHNAYNIHGVTTYDYHGDFPNGVYVQSGLNRDIFSIHVKFPHTAIHVTTQDLRTIYAADGTPIGTLSIHENSLVKFEDTNENGQPDPGEITFAFDHFRLHCG